MARARLVKGSPEAKAYMAKLRKRAIAARQGRLARGKGWTGIVPKSGGPLGGRARRNPLTFDERAELYDRQIRDARSAGSFKDAGRVGPAEYHRGRADVYGEVASEFQANPRARRNFPMPNPRGSAIDNPRATEVADAFATKKTHAVASNFYVHGNTIYSYGPHFPIAEWRGDKVIFTSRKSPSVTTSKHMTYVRRALSAHGIDPIIGDLQMESSGSGRYLDPHDPRSPRQHVPRMNPRQPHGFYVMGRYTSASWWPTRAEAEAEVKRLNYRGGSVYRVEQAYSNPVNVRTTSRGRTGRWSVVDEVEASAAGYTPRLQVRRSGGRARLSATRNPRARRNAGLSITTRYAGPGNVRGSRIIATASTGQRMQVPYRHDLSGEAVHRYAAEQLASKLGWFGGMRKSSELVSGDTKDGYVFVLPEMNGRGRRNPLTRAEAAKALRWSRRVDRESDRKYRYPSGHREGAFLSGASAGIAAAVEEFGPREARKHAGWLRTAGQTTSFNPRRKVVSNGMYCEVCDDPARECIVDELGEHWLCPAHLPKTRARRNFPMPNGQEVPARVSKGIYYFPTFKIARDYALKFGVPTGRIVAYQLGWAVQKEKGGAYWGPKGWSSNPACNPACKNPRHGHGRARRNVGQAPTYENGRKLGLVHGKSGKPLSYMDARELALDVANDNQIWFGTMEQAVEFEKGFAAGYEAAQGRRGAKKNPLLQMVSLAGMNPRKKTDPIDARIEQAWYRLAYGVQVSVMDIPKIFRFIRERVISGVAGPEHDLDKAVREAIVKFGIRTNPRRGIPSTEYSLTSTPMIHTPGVFNYLRQGYRTSGSTSEKDKFVNVLVQGYKITPEIAEGLLDGSIPYKVKGESVVFVAATSTKVKRNPVLRPGPSLARFSAVSRSRRNPVPMPNPVAPPFKNGQRIPVEKARAWVRSTGNKELARQLEEAIKLGSKANKEPDSITWVTVAIGSKSKIDMVTAMAHYGDSPETYYVPPKGSKKDDKTLYRHKWGEGGGGKGTVPLLAAAGGKALLMPLTGKKVANDWLRH